MKNKDTGNLKIHFNRRQSMVGCIIVLSSSSLLIAMPFVMEICISSGEGGLYPPPFLIQGWPLCLTPADEQNRQCVSSETRPYTA